MSEEEKKRRPLVLMQAGPLHLFWTTGVYYYWELAKEFDIVLVVSEAYRSNPDFKRIAALPSTRHVEYSPPLGIVARHFYYRKRFTALLRDFQPQLVLVHNHSYLPDQYLLELCRRIAPSVFRLYYQNGRMSLLWAHDFAVRRAMMIESSMHRYGLPEDWSRLGGLFVDVRNTLAFWFHFKLMPLLTLGTLFRPPVNVFSGRVDREATIRSSSSKNDILLAYLHNEIEVYRQQGTYNVVRIKHPVQNAGKDVIRFLRNDCVEKDAILILPSHGYTSHMVEHGSEVSKLVAHVADRWCEAIAALSAKFAGYQLLLKSHPSANDDPLWQRILERIRQRFPAMIFLPTKHSAEFYIAESKVIASDVSTVLWWTTLWGGKVAISFDIFDYPGGDELKGYEEIVLIQSMEQLDSVRLQSASANASHDLEDVLPLAKRLAGIS